MQDLANILKLHKMWLSGDADGTRADLSYADLSGANLSSAVLRGADLSYADLSRADLSSAVLRGADLSYADLSRADLRGANLSGANLSRADLSGADLSGANAAESVVYNEYTSFFAMQCPESGAYIAYKSARGLIVELEIPKDAKRSSATSRKCRASEAKVISITYPDGTPAGTSVSSEYDRNFVYTVGETVKVNEFEPDRWKECAPGIHHFITRKEAVNYR